MALVLCSRMRLDRSHLGAAYTIRSSNRKTLRKKFNRPVLVRQKDSQEQKCELLEADTYISRTTFEV